MSKVLETKYGRAKVNNKGYYRITSTKEGNFNKLLHRLIYEDYYGPIPKGDYIVHHKDDNKLNNDINNLELMTKTEHSRHHKIGKSLTDETKQKISENHADFIGNKNPNFNPIITIRKYKNKSTKQGFTWIAQPYNHKGQQPLSSVNLEKCIEKVEDFINNPKKNTYGYTDYKVMEE